MNDSPYGPWQNTDLSPSKMKIYNDCTQKFKYRYVDKIRGPTGGAALQGSSLHEIFLEEFLVGGIQDADTLLDMMEMDLKHRLDTQDPRDYRSGLPLTEGEKAEFILQLRIWGKSLLHAMMKGEDHYGNKLNLPNVTETEVEGCVEVYLPRADTTVRLRGYIDLVFEDGSIGDLKLASDYWLAVWTLAKALSEHQPAMYAKMTGLNKFRYLIADKKKNRAGPQEASIRCIDLRVTEKMHENLMKTLEEFVMVTDVLNGYENGIFKPNPEYNGQSKANAGQTKTNFCGKLCDYKEMCFEENFSQEESA
ncbi:MAG: hypothetical protein CMK44_08870 [Porticoccus sp.]|nr:hypothetical protein [Porticoccus sp.]